MPVGTQLQIGQGLAGKVWETGRPLIVKKYRDWEGHLPFLADQIGDRSIIGITVQQGKTPVGVLTITGRAGRFYDESDLTLLNLFAASAAVAIQNAHLYKAQQQAEAERGLLIADLESKNAELERFTYTVSHDLKSPLVTVKGFLGLLQNDLAQSKLDRVQEDISWIREAVERMYLMLDDLLELSRIGRLVNTPQEVSFNELAEEAVKLVSGRITERGVQVEIMPKLPAVVADRARLVEALQNLVDNAVKFMAGQPHPTITIGARQNGTETIFFVRDNGMGIDPQYHDHIFNLFTRLDSSVEGTGIGLALVKRIVEVHGGRIWIESDVNQGAIFCFTLA
jgi:signal transduction histidine kinase